MAIRFQLRELLTARGMTQTELQLQTGLAYSTISDLYHNKARRIDVGTLDALCTALKCGVGDVLEHVAERGRGKSARGS
jgi:putative transcriptional regulator